MKKIGFSLLTFLAFIWLADTHAQTLRIYHIDVGQGDATLFVSPSGHSLLVDSGKNGDGDELLAAMQVAGVVQIDHYVTTHYHGDHYGGIDELTESPGITIVNSYDRGDKNFLPTSKTTQETFIDYQAAVGNKAIHLTRGASIVLDPLMQVTCISSGGVVLGEPDTPHHGEHENDMSISLLIQFGNFHYFIGGDIETPTEDKIAALDVVQDVDVYQANHHGADNGSTQEFIEALQPNVVVISNGSHGGHKHPRQTTLTRLKGLNSDPSIFQTNKYLKINDSGGNVEDEFIADIEAVDDDGTILITVDQTTPNYTVSYRTKSHTFPTRNRTGGSIVIESLLPDPTTGPDRIFEEVTLLNSGSTEVNMAGWILRDESNRTWNLSGLGSIAPNSRGTIVRNAMPMSLNNGGDTIRLINTLTQETDSFTYNASQPGVRIATGH